MAKRTNETITLGSGKLFCMEIPEGGAVPEDATIEVVGYTGDKVCSVCKTVVEKGKEIPKLGVSLTTPTVSIKNTAKGIQVNWNKIENADIIYFGGGDTIKLVSSLRQYNIDKLIFEAVENKNGEAGASPFLCG